VLKCTGRLFCCYDVSSEELSAFRAQKTMNRPANFVSLHPYFKIRPGKAEIFKAGLSAFREKTATEKENLFYDFTINGDDVFCREAYANAEALLAHLENVGALLAAALKMADLTRLEVHGPASELDKLRASLAHLKPAWFVRVES
jgi:quinol monooxygenase YgiN